MVKFCSKFGMCPCWSITAGRNNRTNSGSHRVLSYKPPKLRSCTHVITVAIVSKFNELRICLGKISSIMYLVSYVRVDQEMAEDQLAAAAGSNKPAACHEAWQ